MPALETINESRSFDGRYLRFKHTAETVGCDMTFGVYLPPAAEEHAVPMLLWLSGLTCTDENFMVKAGAQRMAARLGLALVAPDTSPRGTETPGEDLDWDFGTGAGFYVNATESPFDRHYRMFDYVTQELPSVLATSDLALDHRRTSVSGHSMGGHGALVVALRNPGRYRAVSAFAPISAPSECPWGQKAFSGYLGEDRSTWAAWDACELLRTAAEPQTLLVDQGGADSFLEEQLGIDTLEQVCREHGHDLDLRIRPGYDHGYYYVSTFIDEHLEYHAKALQAAS